MQLLRIQRVHLHYWKEKHLFRFTYIQIVIAKSENFIGLLDFVVNILGLLILPKLLSGPSPKIIIALESHMTCYNLNLNFFFTTHIISDTTNSYNQVS